MSDETSKEMMKRVAKQFGVPDVSEAPHPSELEYIQEAAILRRALNQAHSRIIELETQLSAPLDRTNDGTQTSMSLSEAEDWPISAAPPVLETKEETE